MMPQLSPRESEVASLVCEGFTDKAIATRLGISEHTVARHLEHIAEKIGDDDGDRRRRERIKRWCSEAA